VRLLARAPAPEDLDRLTRTLTAIYASSERASDGRAIWGEGWACRWCATRHPGDHPGPCRACGATERAPVYAFAPTRAKLAETLRPGADWQPVASVLEREGRLVGFAFGAVATPARVVAYLREHLGDHDRELRAAGFDRRALPLEAALPASSPLLYLAELAVEAGERRGVEAVQGLTSVLYARAAELGARALVGFTTPRTAAFRLILAVGGEVTLDLGPFVVFRIADFVPVARLLHAATPDELIALLAR
jgi:hypothetical protein